MVGTVRRQELLAQDCYCKRTVIESDKSILMVMINHARYTNELLSYKRYSDFKPILKYEYNTEQTYGSYNSK